MLVGNPLDKFVLLAVLNGQICHSDTHGVRGIQAGSRQAHEHADTAGQPVQEPARTGTGKQPDIDLRHGQGGCGGDQPVTAGLQKPDTAADGNPLGHGDNGPGKGLNGVVGAVAPGNNIGYGVGRVRAVEGMVDFPYIGAGGEATIATGIDQHQTEAVISRPCIQLPLDLAKHFGGQCIKRGRRVQGEHTKFAATAGKFAGLNAHMAGCFSRC